MAINLLGKVQIGMQLHWSLLNCNHKLTMDTNVIYWPNLMIHENRLGKNAGEKKIPVLVKYK